MVAVRRWCDGCGCDGCGRTSADVPQQAPASAVPECRCRCRSAGVSSAGVQPVPGLRGAGSAVPASRAAGTGVEVRSQRCRRPAVPGPVVPGSAVPGSVAPGSVVPGSVVTVATRTTSRPRWAAVQRRALCPDHRENGREYRTAHPGRSRAPIRSMTGRLPEGAAASAAREQRRRGGERKPWSAGKRREPARRGRPT